MHIFTYGSLMFPQIWQRVVRGSYRSAPATAHDFIRLALVDDTYPGMVARAGEQVEGVRTSMSMRRMWRRWMHSRVANMSAPRLPLKCLQAKS